MNTWPRGGPPIGSAVISEYAAAWEGVVVYFGAGWVEVAQDGATITQIEPAYVSGKGYVANTPSARLFFLARHGNAVVRLTRDRHGNPFRKQTLKVLDATWLRPKG